MIEKHPADGEAKRPAFVVSLNGAAEPPAVPRQPRRTRSVYDTPQFRRSLACALDERNRAEEERVTELEELVRKVDLVTQLFRDRPYT